MGLNIKNVGVVRAEGNHVIDGDLKLENVGTDKRCLVCGGQIVIDRADAIRGVLESSCGKCGRPYKLTTNSG